MKVQNILLTNRKGKCMTNSIVVSENENLDVMLGFVAKNTSNV